MSEIHEQVGFTCRACASLHGFTGPQIQVTHDGADGVSLNIEFLSCRMQFRRVCQASTSRRMCKLVAWRLDVKRVPSLLLRTSCVQSRALVVCALWINLQSKGWPRPRHRTHSSLSLTIRAVAARYVRVCDFLFANWNGYACRAVTFIHTQREHPPALRPPHLCQISTERLLKCLIES